MFFYTSSYGVRATIWEHKFTIKTSLFRKSLLKKVVYCIYVWQESDFNVFVFLSQVSSFVFMQKRDGKCY